MEQTENDGILRLWIATPASATAYWGLGRWRPATAWQTSPPGLCWSLPCSARAAARWRSPWRAFGRSGSAAGWSGRRARRSPRRPPALWEARTPYVGKAPAVKALLDELFFHMGSPGLYTLSLQTASEPFGADAGLFPGTCGWSGAEPNDAGLSSPDPGPGGQSGKGLLELYGPQWPGADHHGLPDGDRRLLPDAVDAYNAANGTDWTPLGSVKDYAASPAALWQLTELAPFYPEV